MAFVIKVKVVSGLKGWLLIEFDDHTHKLANINPIMHGYLKKLKDQSFFEEVFVDSELQTVTWPGELHLDPDSLYQQGIEIEQAKNLVKAVKDNEAIEKFIDKGVI